MKNKFPKPTKSIAKAKKDLFEWGYCLLKDAIPPELNKKITKRLIEQADAEKKLNIAYEDGSKEKNGVSLLQTKNLKGLIKEFGCFQIRGRFF